jgi:hypothetical protein
VPAVVSKPFSARRRDDRTTDAWRGISADTAVLLTAALGTPGNRAALICHSGGE